MKGWVIRCKKVCEGGIVVCWVGLGWGPGRYVDVRQGALPSHHCMRRKENQQYTRTRSDRGK